MRAFAVTPWRDIERFYLELIDDGMTLVELMLTLVRSVIAEDAAGSLAAHTSMHDLVVTTVPVSLSPDWIRVALIAKDNVRIEHQTPTGPGDVIERRIADVLPLFWRFSIEKWGIHPARDLG